MMMHSFLTNPFRSMQNKSNGFHLCLPSSVILGKFSLKYLLKLSFGCERNATRKSINLMVTECHLQSVTCMICMSHEENEGRWGVGDRMEMCSQGRRSVSQRDTWL